MSVRFLALVRRIDKVRAGLSVASTCLLWALADHADPQGRSYAGQERLGRETCMSARHVRRCLAELLDLGLLEWSRASRTESNHYKLKAEILASLPQVSSGLQEPLASGHGSPVASGHGCPLDERTPESGRNDAASGHGSPVREDICDTSSGHGCPDKRQRSVSRSVRREDLSLAALASPGRNERPIGTNGKPPPKAAKARGKHAPSASVLDVFQAWATARKKKHPKGEPKCDAKRAKCIAARLDDGFDVETLKLAAEGIWLDRFNLGENERGREYTAITLALRDADHVERFAELARKAQMQAAPKPTALPPREPRATPEQIAETRKLFADLTKAKSVDAFLAAPTANGGK